MSPGIGALCIGVALTIAPGAAEGRIVGAPSIARESCDTLRGGQTAAECIHTTTLLGVNAVLSGAVAGILQWARGGELLHGFTRGALGGALVYGGKRIAVGNTPGAGLAGRQIAAVGASIVHNASEGEPSFDELVIPVGLVDIHYSRGASSSTRVRLDVLTTAAFLYGLIEPSWRFEAGASLSAGTPVFQVDAARQQERRSWLGRTVAGVILVRSDPADWSMAGHRRVILAHERVHLLQDDHLSIGVGRSLQRGLLTFVPGGERIDRRVDLGLHNLLTVAASLLIEDSVDYPWELEARRLSWSDQIFRTPTGPGRIAPLHGAWAR